MSRKIHDDIVKKIQLLVREQAVLKAKAVKSEASLQDLERIAEITEKLHELNILRMRFPKN